MWLDHYKEKHVKAWVYQHAHFDNTSISQCEGIHHLIKTYLGSSQLDLFEAWRSIKLALVNQLEDLDTKQTQQQIRTLIELCGVLFRNIHGWISYEALRKVELQRKRLLEKDLPACTGAFARSLGIPCAHDLVSMVDEALPL